MKNKLLAIVSIWVPSVFAQTFSDNFDTYTVGGLVAQQSAGVWTTWSNAPGGAEDVIVSSAQSASAPNSLYLSSTAATGGPDDLVKVFNATPLVSGNFNLKMKFNIETGKAAYFNLQGTSVLGGQYAVDAFFKDNGTLVINNPTDGQLLSVPYPEAAWFAFELDIDLSSNNWNVKINGTSVGTFSNSINSIASIDIFPVDNDAPTVCGFYVDDFEYTITPYTAASFDAALTVINNVGAEIATLDNTVSATVRNLGNTVITSYTLNYLYNGINTQQVVTGQNLALLASNTTSTQSITLVPGSNPLTVTLIAINGMLVDDVVANNTKSIAISPIVPALGKVVVGEEGTGTWCQYCPRGAVFMDKFSVNYDKLFAGIAVHNADPMTVTTYDTGIAFTSFPSMKVDRGTTSDPSSKESEIITRLQVAPKGTFVIGAQYTAGTRELKVSVATTFNTAVSTAYKLALVLTEDDVRGTTAGYNQVNNFSGGATPMGGYELLANPVPAAQMVYDHVARSIQPSFAGDPVFGASVAVGATFLNNYTIVLPATWDETMINIIPLLVATNGVIDNAGKATIAEAVTNGYTVGLETNITSILDGPDATLIISPNPTDGNITFKIQQDASTSGNVIVYDLNGKSLFTAAVSGNQMINFDSSTLDAGVYIVELNQGQTKTTKRMIVR
jgi:Outer membrane protein Omp28/Secretion system C-terminal sorting domain